MHGGVSLTDLCASNPAAVERGIENLEKHVENCRNVRLEPIVAINKFPTDTPEEIEALSDCCRKMKVTWALSDVWARGGDGGTELSELVIEACKSESMFEPAYCTELSIQEKVDAVARGFYGADGVDYLPAAHTQIKQIESLGFGNLPICVAKTQNSLSDNAKVAGRPRDYRITIRGAKVSAGAGFVVLYAGDIMTMPGLPKVPAAVKIGMKPDGEIYGLF